MMSGPEHAPPVYVWTHPSTFYAGPCFQCGIHFEKEYPLKIRCEEEAIQIHFCTYGCLYAYRENPSYKKS